MVAASLGNPLSQGGLPNRLKSVLFARISMTGNTAQSRLVRAADDLGPRAILTVQCGLRPGDIAMRLFAAILACAVGCCDRRSGERLATPSLKGLMLTDYPPSRCGPAPPPRSI